MILILYFWGINKSNEIFLFSEQVSWTIVASLISVNCIMTGIFFGFWIVTDISPYSSVPRVLNSELIVSLVVLKISVNALGYKLIL